MTVDRRPGRGELGDDARQPARRQGRRGAALGLRGRGRGDGQPGAREPAVPAGRSGCRRRSGRIADAWRRPRRRVIVSRTAQPRGASVVRAVASSRAGHAGGERHEGHRGRHARAHVAGARRSACRRAASSRLSGPSFAVEVAQGQPTAVVAAARDRVRRARRAAPLRDAGVPGVFRARRHRRRAGRGAQERDRRRGGHPRRARARPQSARRAHHARARRDHAARRRDGRGPADVRRARRAWAIWCSRHGQPEPQSRARASRWRRARRSSSYRAAHRTRGRRAPTPRALAPRSGARTGVELPIIQKVCEVLFEREAGAATPSPSSWDANSRRSSGDDHRRGRSRSFTPSVRSARSPTSSPTCCATGKASSASSIRPRTAPATGSTRAARSS